MMARHEQPSGHTMMPGRTPRTEWRRAVNAGGRALPRKRVVLVVEDDRPIGELLASIINDEEGYVAIHVTRPGDALEILKKVRPDLLVLDVGLPEMSGIELYDRVQADEQLRRIP